MKSVFCHIFSHLTIIEHLNLVESATLKPANSAYPADSRLSLSQYSMSSALSAYFGWLLTAWSQFFNLISCYLWENKADESGLVQI